ncbi:carbonic anhydrase [Fusarium austroafricanum]|uniref:carbonic anhydrase n=1 Tax=Fusarium austroafricanum TaxID=2364996 RepID=A0A8H4P2I0_9HYPO|nr:carbonic anhydrase [Fusarium austroafricanum]
MHSWILLLAAYAPQALASCAYGTHLHARSDTIKAPKFGYSAANGPANWYNLDPKANKLCATGDHQSPINMADGSFKIIPASDLHIEIPNFKEAEFENLGSTIEVVTEGLGGKITIDGTDYHLKQFHFHLPSEHLDNGTSMAMEMHMVHSSKDKKLAVIGVYIDLDDGLATGTHKSKIAAREDRKDEACATHATKSAVVTKVLNSVDKIAHLGQTTHIKNLKMSEIVSLLNDGDFQSYSGSLTTPPCSEDVKWFVSTQKVSIPTRTYLKARSVIGYNARFPQNVPGEENILSLVSDKLHEL